MLGFEVSEILVLFMNMGLLVYFHRHVRELQTLPAPGWIGGILWTLLAASVFTNVEHLWPAAAMPHVLLDAAEHTCYAASAGLLVVWILASTRRQEAVQ